MMEIQIQNRKTDEEIYLKLPMNVEELKKVICVKGDFFIKRVKLKCKIQVKANEDIHLLNKMLQEFQSLCEQDKLKVLAINSFNSFCESMNLRCNFELIPNVFNKLEYGMYVAKHEVKLSKRFLKHMDFQKYGEELLKVSQEYYFTRYGVVRRCT